MAHVSKWIICSIGIWINTLNAEIEFSHQTHAYHTHQPVLYEIAAKTSGPVIEFGCGFGSTDLLHEICKTNKRLLVSIDDDMDWLNIFSNKYGNDSEWHKFIFVPGKSQNNPESPQHWISFLRHCKLVNMDFDVCFIDQNPWLGRFETIKHMKSHAKYVIVHDCDYFPTNGVFGTTILPISESENIPGVFDFSDIFQHYKVYFPTIPWPVWTGPPTLLGSDFEQDLPDVDSRAYLNGL